MKKRNLLYKKAKGFCGQLLAFAMTVSIAVTSMPQTAKAEEYWPDAGAMTSQCAIVMEMNSGAILYGQNIDEVNYPASITKVLTADLVLENCQLDEVVTFSDDAVEKNEGDTSHISRDYGEQMTVEECLYALLLFSANECAYALAEHVGEKLGGDYQTFIDLMNERAKKLGCTNTHFANPNGLPDDDHYTTVHDMALIAADAYKNETFRIIITTETYTIPPTNKHSEPTYLYNQHNMFYPSTSTKYLYDYCTGGKTGYTDAAGNTLVTFAEKDGMKLVCVIMKSHTPQHYLDTITLFDFCFNNFQLVNISENETTSTEENLKSMGILNNNESFATLDKSASIVIPSTASFQDAQVKLSSEHLEDGTVAKIEYTYAGHLVGDVEIVANVSAIPENDFEDTKEFEDPKVEKVVKIKPVWIGIVILLLALLALAIFFGKKLIDNFYWIRHQREVKKARRQRLNGVSKDKPKKRRKRDRLFK